MRGNIPRMGRNRKTTDFRRRSLRFLETHGGRRLAAHIDDREAGGIQAARHAVLVVGELELAVARAERDGAAPGQHRVALPDRASVAVDRFGVAVEPARIAVQVRPQALAGRHAIPAAADDVSHLDHTERGHHRVFGIIAPGKTDAFRIGGGVDQRIEKIRLRHRVGRQLAVVHEFRQRGLRLGALHAVDRIGVVTGDRQQALHPGKLRLRVVVVGFFRKVDRRSFRGFGGLRGGETRLLADRTAARIGDLEIAVADAQLGMSGLRHRRAAVDRRRARMHIDHVDVERAVHDLAAGAGIDAEPAAGRDIGAFFQPDRRFHPITGAIAQSQFGMRRRRRQRERRACRCDDTGETANHAAMLAGRPPQRCISVPTPWSVSSSSRTACGILPSMMTTPSTPWSSASMQVSTLGIIPPEMVPSAIRRRASATDSSVIRFLSLSSTPVTSVSSSSRLALSAPAMAPAKVSALTLKVPPLADVATGASTGIISLPSTWLSTVRSTFSGSPTKPRSTTFSMLESGSTTVRVTLRAVTMLPSLPHSPTALPPAALM